jgi:anti-anti-sigma factor
MKVSDEENDMSLMTDESDNQILVMAGTDQEDAESVISLDSTLTIQHVVKLHERLKRSYAAHDSIEIDASQVASIDTTTLQLLVSLKKEAAKQQKDVVITAPSKRFIESAELLGFLEILGIDTLG